jgi:diguanylate cyclase (GGDEF)-like protein/PAS domain S-box-containing protein
VRELEALRHLAKIANEGLAARHTVDLATSIIRQATSAAEAAVVYAQAQDLLVCSDPDDSTNFTQIALWVVQRQIMELGGPVAFNLKGHRVEDFVSAASADQREFLALAIPTAESASELCILRGVCERKACARLLRFMESAMPALTTILERFLNVDRGRRLADKLSALANSAQVLTQVDSLETALTNLATALARSTASDYLTVDVYDGDSGRFVLRILSESRFTRLSLAQAWIKSLDPDRPDVWNEETMRSRQPFLVPDIQKDERVPESVRQFFRVALLRSMAIFPMLLQDEFLGTVSFAYYAPHTFPPEQVNYLQSFVTQAATALKAVQMHKELHRSAQELKRAADMYIATTNMTGDIIVRLDEHSRWVLLNDAACQFFGRPRDELLGAQSTDYVHPEDVASTTQAIRETRARKELVRGFVHRFLTPMGPRVVEWNAWPLFDEQGQYTATQITGRDITERRQIEDVLAAKTEEYIATTNLTGDIIARLDKRGRWAFLNDAACQFYGKPREELLGIGSRAYVHPEDLEATAQVIRETRARKSLTTGFVNRQVTPLGARVVEWNGYPIFDEQGDYAGIQITGRDITERRQIEDALEESERRYRLLTESTSDLIWTMDMGLRYTYMSPAVTRMRGFTVEEIVGASVAQTTTPASLEVARKTLAEQLTLEKMEDADPNRTVKVELEMYCKDGSTIWTEMNMVFLRDREGNPVGILGVTRDISERKRMEEALRESERRYRLLTENTSDLIWTMDIGLRYTYMSPVVTRMRGFTVEEIVGASVAQTMTPASLEVARKTLAEQLALERMGDADPNRSAKVELEMYCKDGSTIWTEMSMIFLRDSDGRPVGILGVTRNISERKKAEEERERLHAELEVRAITDGLTGLYNHVHFFERLGEEVERSKRYNRVFAVVMMDVDNFKLFNDSYGHQAGDAVLRLVADGIRSGLRSSDLAFRYGGDEFAAILLHADPKKAHAVIDRIRRRIARSLKQMDIEAPDDLALSIGVAHFPNDGTTADALVRVADTALYSAKGAALTRDVASESAELAAVTAADPEPGKTPSLSSP